MIHPLIDHQGHNVFNAMPIGIRLDYRTKPGVFRQSAQGLAQISRDLHL